MCVCVCQDVSPNSLDKNLSNMKQQSLLQQDRNLSESITFTFSNVYHVVFEIFHQNCNHKRPSCQVSCLGGISPNQQRLGIAGLTTAANGIAYVTSNKKEPSVGASRGSWTRFWRRNSWEPCGRRRLKIIHGKSDGIDGK